MGLRVSGPSAEAVRDLDGPVRDLNGRFKAGNRQEAWEEAAKLLPPGDPYRRTLQRFQRTLARYEALDRLRAIRPLPVAKPSRRLAARGPRRRNPKPLHLVKGTPEARAYMISMRNRYYSRLSWKDPRWKDPQEKRRRLEPMWRARRRAKDLRLLESVDPHIRKVLGDRAVLQRLGRLKLT